MSTNKPSIVSVVLKIDLMIWEKNIVKFHFYANTKTLAIMERQDGDSRSKCIADLRNLQLIRGVIFTHNFHQERL